MSKIKNYLIFLFVLLVTILGLSFYIVLKPDYYSYNLFKNIDLTEQADWLLVESDGVVGGGVSVIFEKKILNELLNELKTNPVKECDEATTPFSIISFYRNGERVAHLSRCAWINSSYDLDILSKNFISATWKFEKISSIKEYNSVLNTLKQKNNVYILSPKDFTQLKNSKSSQDVLDYSDTTQEFEITYFQWLSS